jgi:methylated-DNA-[protein]-cysteine S-methyltransferase
MKLVISTADGDFTAHYSERGLAQLDFPGDQRANAHDNESIPQAREWHPLTTRALEDILAGRDPAELPPFDLSRGTDFQRRVWNELLRIPAGRTKSYGEIAEAVGEPKAARAVGAACGSNPIPVIIPCHRVLAANGKRGGYSGAAGWKEKLLAYEGAQLL